MRFYNIINAVLQTMLGVSDIHAVLPEADSQGFSVLDSPLAAASGSEQERRQCGASHLGG